MRVGPRCQRVLEAACQIQVAAQASPDLTQVPAEIVRNVAESVRVQTGGMSGAFVWPALLRKLDRIDPSYRS